MGNLKKLTLALMALGFAGTAAAAGYAPPPMAPTGIPVTLPQTESRWDIGIEALWMRPGTTEEVFAAHGTLLDTTTGEFDFFPGKIHQKSVRPNFEWGFKLEGSYHFAGSGTNIHLNWLRVHGSDDDHVTCTGAQSAIGTMGSSTNLVCAPIFSPLGTYTYGAIINGSIASFPNTNDSVVFSDTHPKDIHAKVRFDYDIINFVFGQHVDFGQYLDVNFDAGFQYARIDHEFEIDVFQERNTSGSEPETTHRYTATFFEHADSRVHGFGPTIGADAVYEFGNGFSGVVHSRVALLYANRKYNSRVEHTVNEVQTSVSPEVVTIDNEVAYGEQHFDSNRIVIPTAELAIGARFTHDMGDNSNVYIEAGWRQMYYAHAVRGDHGLTRDGATAMPATLSGPYIGVKYIG